MVIIKKIIVVFLSLILSFMVCISCFALTNTYDGAKAIAVMEAASGRCIYEKDSHEKLPVASTTKIMTAIIAMNEPYRNEVFTIDPKALLTEGSCMGLRNGDKITLSDLVYGMMLSSGNDAANAVAFRVAGSKEAFVEMMNKKAKELGMTDTHFSTPSGLDEGENYSSARDMAILASEALKNEELAKIVSTKGKTIEFGDPVKSVYYRNHNRLLWDSDDVIGVKTGFTKKAGRCLVSAKSFDGQVFIIVTLNAGDDFNLHRKIYEDINENLESTDFGFLLENIKIPVTGGNEEFINAAPSLHSEMCILKGEKDLCSIKYLTQPFLYAPVKKGQQVGNVEIEIDGRRVALVPLNSLEELIIDRNSISIVDRIKDFFSSPEIYSLP